MGEPSRRGRRSLPRRGRERNRSAVAPPPAAAVSAAAHWSSMAAHFRAHPAARRHPPSHGEGHRHDSWKITLVGGGGFMGRSLAQKMASSGIDVTVLEVSEERIARRRARQ